jgi:hypothetical protein
MSDRAESHRYDSGVTEPTKAHTEPANLQPGQWTLRHLIIVLAVVAVGSAIVAPWLRLLSARQLAITGAAWATALIVAACFFNLGTFVRKRQLKGAGKCLLRVDFSLRAGHQWLWWSNVLIAIFLGVLLTAYLCIAPPSRDLDLSLALQIFNPSFLLGITLGNVLLWSSNAYGRFEICENGLVIQKSIFVRWSKITRVEWTDEPRGTLVVYANHTRHVLPIDAKDREAVRDLIAAHWSGTHRPTATEPQR